MVGFFSKTAADDGRIVAIYEGNGGKEVEVTGVYENEQRGQEIYLPLYPDAVMIGPVYKFVQHKRSANKRCDIHDTW